MDTIEIIVVALAASLVVFTIVYNIIRKAKGKTACGSCVKEKGSQSCSSCAGCMYESECTKKRENKQK